MFNDGAKIMCDECSLVKAKQKYINKKVTKNNSRIYERFYTDISLVNGSSFGNKKFWIMLIGEKSDMMWSTFLNQKSDLSSRLIDTLKDIKNKFKCLKCIRWNIYCR